MANWPTTVFLNTGEGQYRADDFAGPHAQPTWVNISGILREPPYDELLSWVGQMLLDPHAPLERQFYLDASGYLFVRENNGDWVERWNGADTFALLGWAPQPSDYFLRSFCLDPIIPGRVYVYFTTDSWYDVPDHPNEHYILRSDDYGVTFSAVQIENNPDLELKAPGAVVSHGNFVAIMLNFSGEGIGDNNNYLYVSSDGGVTWGKTFIDTGLGRHNTGLAMDPRGDRVYFQRENIERDYEMELGICYLGDLTLEYPPAGRKLGNYYYCDDHIPLGSGVGLIFDPQNPDHQWLWSSCDDDGYSTWDILRLFETFDCWQTRSELPSVGIEDGVQRMGLEPRNLPPGAGLYAVQSGDTSTRGLYAFENNRPDLAVKINGGLDLGQDTLYPSSLLIPPPAVPSPPPPPPPHPPHPPAGWQPIVVATENVGVFRADFDGSSPTWKLQPGAGTYWGRAAADPFAPSERRYGLRYFTGLLWQNGGVWEPLFTNQQAEALLQSQYPGATASIENFWCDRTVPGRLWALAAPSNQTSAVPALNAFRSDDHGNSWTLAFRLVDISNAQMGDFVSHGNQLWVCVYDGDGGQVRYSPDLGQSWTILGTQHQGSFGSLMYHPQGRVYWLDWNDNRFVCHDGQALSYPPALNEPGYVYSPSLRVSYADPNTMWLLDSSGLYKTTDNWATRTKLGDTGESLVRQVLWDLDDSLHLVAVGNTLYAFENDAYDLKFPIMGTDDPLPATMRVCRDGLLIDYSQPPPGVVRTYAVAMPGVTAGGLRGEPLPGDRAAWDALGYPERHANDIEAAGGLHHRLGSGPCDAAPGDHTHPDLATKAESHYEHIQVEPSQLWIINHGMNKYPSVSVVDSAKTLVYGEVVYTDANSLILQFSAPFAGRAYLN